MRRVLLATAFVCFVGVLPQLEPIPLPLLTPSPAPLGDQAFEPVDSQMPGVTASAITRGPGLSTETGLNSINSDAWTSGLIDAGDYYELDDHARHRDEPRRPRCHGAAIPYWAGPSCNCSVMSMAPSLSLLVGRVGLDPAGIDEASTALRPWPADFNNVDERR